MNPDALRATFDAPRPFTVGIEEEVFLLDPATFELSERAPELLERLGGPGRFKLELPAAQIELITRPHDDVAGAMAELAGARRELLAAAEGLVAPAGTGVHPFSPEEGALNSGPRYDRTAAEYGRIARRQLVSALQVHVAVGGAERTLAVYNALREHLPALAALAANAPFHGGADTGLASVRPKISEGLPRQGVPPAFASWEALERELRWGEAAGVLPEPALWWWELRPHLTHGTLELRVPDTQTTIAEAGAVAAVAHALVVWLADRHDAGDLPEPAPTWRISENRWSACRHGVEGELADVRTGERRATRAVLRELLDTIGADAALPLVELNGALRQREVAGEHGIRALGPWLAERFAAGL
ncbi:MAG: YbdK family carboxylate-amine ligase [Thermoleophilaceae bacterium]|nr:YbdK family carboxylate-amine ligase [Thermoleophilaceae bacterium]